ncbi:MAG: hypothetical protein MI717_00110 [Spirochaetales bacterium]|nr:hypothetical protein [Spirochaetales bacterium]
MPRPPLFAVRLKDEAHRRLQEGRGLFQELENPWETAQHHCTPGRVYPVMDVDSEGRFLTIIDDDGLLWMAHVALFKFSSPP